MKINSISDFFSLVFNPISPQFHAFDDFVNILTCTEKIKVIASTIFAGILTAGLGVLATFRCSVSVYKISNHPLPPPKQPLQDYILCLLEGAPPPLEYREIGFYRRSEVSSVLSGMFGEKAASAVMEMYKTSKRKNISSVTVHALLIGIVANLTLEDVKYIFNTFETTALNQTVARALENAGEISDPTELEKTQILQVLSSLRSLPSINFNPVYVNEFKQLGYFGQIQKDCDFLKACQRLDNYNLSEKVGTRGLIKFTYSEYLARHIIYGIASKGVGACFSEGTLVPVRLHAQTGDRAELMIMRAHRMINSKGLHGVVLLPAELETQRSNESHVPVYVLFRGTRSRYGWYRNLHPSEKHALLGWSGPGLTSFERYSDEMLSNFKKFLSSLPKGSSIKLEIFGHSLGATDSQRFCDLVSQKLLDQDYNVAGCQVNEINLYGFNSPGVEEQVNERFLNNLRKLKKIKFQLRYFKVQSDPVQTTANQLLGYIPPEVDKIANLFVTVFKIGKKPAFFPQTQTLAHTEKLLCNYLDIECTKPNDAWIKTVKTTNPDDLPLTHFAQEKNDHSLDPDNVFNALNNRGVWKKRVLAFFGLNRSLKKCAPQSS